MNARRYPRTLSEAFGPYERGPVHPMPDNSRPRLWLWITVYATAAIVLAVVI